MKTRFNTFDIVCVVGELQRYIGMRVNNIYDIDNKTYLIKLQRTEEKAMILLESGIRIHSTAFEWPKNVAPCGFSMKMRKHLKNKRLESLKQLGTDRIIDLQFGTGEAAYHLILELYDRGNIILTDFELKTLYILRPHTEGDKIKFGIRELYPQNRARESSHISREELMAILEKTKVGDQLKKVLVSQLEYGPAVLEHVLIGKGFNNSTKIGKTFNIEGDIELLMEALVEAENIFLEARLGKCKGYLIQKKEERSNTQENSEKEEFLSNQEFHPLLFKQHEALPYKEFECFNEAVDIFFSSLESQKIELKGIQQEKEAMKKLDNVKKDHKQRLVALENTQKLDKQKAELITRNQGIVEKAIMAVQSALASQLPWTDIKDLVKEASATGDPIAKIIKDLKLESNHISLYLTDPYESEDCSNSGDDAHENGDVIPPMTVDVDLALSAFANATRYYDQKRHAAKKKQKTLESQIKAFKSAEKKTKQTLKEVQVLTNIHKARKVFWFEKFFWFISSENFLVIAGRDQQQNELIVKRYLKPTDVYVHADIHGASSVIIKNPSGQSIPPKTLNEAGTMAICYSVAWEAKVVTNAYWVWGEQVSKTAPTGEYLTTGSFMVRGKKNFLPPSHLILGLGFLFKLEDGCVANHKGERKVAVGTDDDVVSLADTEQTKDDDIELEIEDESDEKNQKSDEHNISDKNDHENVSKENNVESDSTDSEEENNKFPDTQLKIQHMDGTKINILMESVIPNTKSEETENIFFLGDNKPVILKNTQRNRKPSESTNKKTLEEKDKITNKESNNKQQVKRGQKSKLKKIKEKYKDQDEEERQMRMEILQSSGLAKESKKDKKNKETNKNSNRKLEPKTFRLPQVQKGIDDDGGDEEVVVQLDIDVIDTLTGIPTSEDDLIFAVPVIAPYNVLSNYKFKVKLTPGIGKKGKAAKTAVAMFMKDRTITQREKDLLKAVKDDQLARNFPGKVKLSAPRLQIVKK